MIFPRILRFPLHYESSWSDITNPRDYLSSKRVRPNLPFWPWVGYDIPQEETWEPRPKSPFAIRITGANGEVPYECWLQRAVISPS